jgi:DNA polymerase II small subunit/DNA polymerase delta subunit B
MHSGDVHPLDNTDVGDFVLENLLHNVPTTAKLDIAPGHHHALPEAQ